MLCGIVAIGHIICCFIGFVWSDGFSIYDEKVSHYVHSICNMTVYQKHTRKDQYSEDLATDPISFIFFLLLLSFENSNKCKQISKWAGVHFFLIWFFCFSFKPILRFLKPLRWIFIIWLLKSVALFVRSFCIFYRKKCTWHDYKIYMTITLKVAEVAKI